MQRIIIAIISFLVLSIPVFGSDWKQVGTGPNDNPVYLDIDRILTKNKNYRVWWKVKYNTPEKNDSGKLIVEALINSEINCSKRTFKNLSVRKYFKDGDFDSGISNAEHTGIQPDSVIDMLSKILCK
ncbi:MAG: surface-adhesin E family protein [Thermodesulfovibrionales bacterium]